jgi:hypothetical protein
MPSKRSAADMEEPCGEPSRSSGDAPLTREDISQIIQDEVKKALQAAMAAARLTTRIEVIFNAICEDPELEEIGIKLQGDEGKKICAEKGYIATSHFLKQMRVAKCCKGAFTLAFTKELRARKIRECREQKTKVYLLEVFNMWRPAYMVEDRPLMETTFEDMQERLEDIHKRHA